MARTTFEEINIGPFVGGLNTLSDQSSISDTELIEMVNFECDKDGSLVSRPPIFKSSPDGDIHATAGSLKIIGYFVDAASGAYYLIGSNRVSRTAYYANGVWTTITDTFAATASVQFRDALHLLAPLTSPNPSGTWTPSGGFSAVPTMPKGAAIVANKERLWVAQGKEAPSNGSRVYVSDISSGSLVWDGDFINIQQGDGQNIVDLAVVYSDLIVFKQRSTYRFAFDADIATGQVTRLSDNIGASDTGCFASLEDRLFVLFDNVVYDFTSYRFTRLNTTVPLKSDVASGTLSEVRGISVWSDRLFVNYFGRTLVYNLITRVWCEWQSPSRAGSIGRLFTFPVQVGTSQQAFLYSVEPLGSAKGRMLYRISDQFDSTGNDDYTTENYTCHFETKNYDYKSPSKFKRLGLWGADILSRTNIDVQAKPVTYGRPVTWDTLKYGPGGPGAQGYIMVQHPAPFTSANPTVQWGETVIEFVPEFRATGYTWNSVPGTWDRPVDTSYVVSDNVAVEDISEGRKWVKFLKSLRFRQIAFRASANTDGTSRTAPIRVFSLTTYVKEKQLVPRKIN